MRWPVRAALTAAVAVCALIFDTAAMAGAAPRPQADTSDPAPVVTITALSPTTLEGATNTITVSGRVTNPTSQPLHNAAITLDVSTHALELRTVVTAWNRGSTRGVGTLWQLGRKDLDNLAPGASTSFTLEAPASALPATALARFGAHALRVSMQAIGNDGEALRADAHSFLLVDPPSAGYTPTPLLVLADVTAPPTTLTTLTSRTGAGAGIVRDDFLPNEPARVPAPGVASVLTALNEAGPGIAYLVDPALLTTTSPLATSRLSVRRRTTVTIDPAVAELLASAQAHGASVSLGLWGSPERALANRLGARDVLDTAAAMTRDVREVLDRDLATGPSLELATSAQADDLPQATSVLPVVSSATVHYAQQNYRADARARLIESGRDVLVADDDLSAALSLPATTPEAALAQRQYVAALVAQQNSERPYTPRLLVAEVSATSLATPSTRDTLASLFARNWVNPARMSDATKDVEREPVQALPPEETSAAGLAEALQTCHDALERIEAVADHAALLARPVLWQRSFAMARGLTPQQRQLLATRLGAQSREILSAVRTTTAPSVNIISRTAEIPVQVTNDLPYPVRVSVDVQAVSPIVTTTTTKARVPGRASVTVRVPVEVRSNGDARAVVALRSDSGIEISATERVVLHAHRGFEDRFLLVMAAAVVLLFLAGLARSISRGRRMAPDTEA